MLILYTITPLLGALRNYCKYKEFKLKLFIRTPFTYYVFYKICFQFQKKYTINPFMIMMFERWFFLVFKTFLSIINDDYNIKKQKYIKKYNLKYNDNLS